MTLRRNPLNRDPRAALLRRYLRAVLGDQATGDRLAAALWPAIPSEGGDAPLDPADVLCRAMRRWRRLYQENARSAPFSHAAIAKAVSPGRMPSRQAGILVDVFSLTVAQAARALDRSEGEVTMLLATARAEAGAPLGEDVLVVEDSGLVAQHLAQLALEVGARSVGVAGNASEAFEAAARCRPGIVLCDYDLGEEITGAAVARRLAAEHDTVCLFVTAYPDEVLSGTDGEPAFIISKPFTESVLRAALRYAATAERPAVLAA